MIQILQELEHASLHIKKADRDHGFDVTLGQVVSCHKPRWICCMHSNDVGRQIETPGKSAMNLSAT